ncbi:MAG: YbaN family protein [Telluria sp.]
MKLLLTLVGMLAIVLGVIGIFLPLLPTTPFLLLAAACFARSSTRMHDWMMQHRLFGDYLRNYEAGRGIPARAKLLALVMMWSSLSYAVWRFESLWLRVLIVTIGAGVSIYLLLLPSYVKPGPGR